MRLRTSSRTAIAWLRRNAWPSRSSPGKPSPRRAPLPQFPRPDPLAERLQAALDEEFPLEQQIEAERSVGIEPTIETVHQVLSDYRPLDRLVAQAVPRLSDPAQDLCFIVRVGALFPFYRTFSLLEQFKGQIAVATILFYPGELDGPAGLRFMGILDEEHNYRPKIS